nr:PEPxxWA-CTERM sorting domain-containing protein [Parasphingorhabdus marina]
MRKTLLISTAIAMLAAPGCANAAIVMKSLDITGSDFSLRFGNGSVAPADPFSVVFSVTFDNSSDVNRTTNGLNIISSTLPYSAEYAYNSSRDVLTLATDVTDDGSCLGSANSFCIFVNNFSTAPNASFFNQVTGGNGGPGIWVANRISTSAVPEPATWAFMIFGFGAIGGAMRRQRKTTLKVNYT